jgi:hypothetical protein
MRASDSFSRTNRRLKFNRTFSTMTPNEKKLGATFSGFNFKPLVLERKLGEQADLMNMSNDAISRLDQDDRKDQKMVIPISGYSGHRRGDKSQNFFGKSFREVSLQSKKLQRELSREP